MIDVIDMLLPLMTGVLLGGFFFGGLWWTVRRGLSAPHPAFLFVSSGLLRMSLTLAGFYLVSGGHWQQLLSCLAGFLLGRLFVTIWIRSVATESPPGIRKTDHASQP